MMTGKGRRDGLHPDFLRCLDWYADQALARYGIVVTMVQGRRTWAEQDYFWQGWLKRLPGFNLAAEPGTSNHEKRPDGWAYAADLNPNVGDIPVLRDLLASCGLYLSVRWPDGRVREPWHVEPIWRHGGKRPAWLDAPPPSLNVPQPEDDDMDQLYRMSGTGELFVVAAGRRRPVLAGLESALAASGQIRSATATEVPDAQRDAFLAAFPDQLEK